MNVLMSAYACEPGRGSEPGAGWNMARELARCNQIWVLTTSAHRQPIEAELARTPVANLRVIYLDPFGWTYDWSDEAKTHWGVYLHYYLWQVLAYFVAKHHHRQIKFDLAHHVTYGKYSTPSFLALLPIPFVWGPAGGGESAPPGFWTDFSPRSRIYERLRSLARWMGEHDPFVRMTCARSRLTWATTDETALRLRKMGARNVHVFPQVGLQPSEICSPVPFSRADNEPMRFISVGRLLHWKGFHLGLRAFAATGLRDEEYWIIGDGPEKLNLQKLAETLGIASQVKFWSYLSRPETLKKMGLCSALIHPSLHESGGLVCLEAMAARCPVICLDLGGPALQVTAATGFKVQANSPDDAIAGIKDAMLTLTHDPNLRHEMGLRAQARVKEVFSWEEKGRFVARAYHEILTSEGKSKSGIVQTNSYAS